MSCVKVGLSGIMQPNCVHCADVLMAYLLSCFHLKHLKTGQLCIYAAFLMACLTQGIMWLKLASNSR